VASHDDLLPPLKDIRCSLGVTTRHSSCKMYDVEFDKLRLRRSKHKESDAEDAQRKLYFRFNADISEIFRSKDTSRLHSRNIRLFRNRTIKMHHAWLSLTLSICSQDELGDCRANQYHPKVFYRLTSSLSGQLVSPIVVSSIASYVILKVAAIAMWTRIRSANVKKPSSVD